MYLQGWGDRRTHAPMPAHIHARYIHTCVHTYIHTSHTYLRTHNYKHRGCHARVHTPKSSPAANAVELRGGHRRLNPHRDFAACKRWEHMQGEAVSNAIRIQRSAELFSNASLKSAPRIPCSNSKSEHCEHRQQKRAGTLCRFCRSAPQSQPRPPAKFHISAALRRVLPTVPPEENRESLGGVEQQQGGFVACSVTLSLEVSKFTSRLRAKHSRVSSRSATLPLMASDSG